MNNTESKEEKNVVVPNDPGVWGQQGRETFQWVEPIGDFSLRSFRKQAEVQAIYFALGKTGWNRKRAAKLLSISYRSLLYKIRQHNITPTPQQN